jgi:hypothetical protein
MLSGWSSLHDPPMPRGLMAWQLARQSRDSESPVGEPFQTSRDYQIVVASAPQFACAFCRRSQYPHRYCDRMRLGKHPQPFAIHLTSPASDGVVAAHSSLLGRRQTLGTGQGEHSPQLWNTHLFAMTEQAKSYRNPSGLRAKSSFAGTTRPLRIPHLGIRHGSVDRVPFEHSTSSLFNTARGDQTGIDNH